MMSGHRCPAFLPVAPVIIEDIRTEEYPNPSVSFAILSFTRRIGIIIIIRTILILITLLSLLFLLLWMDEMK